MRLTTPRTPAPGGGVEPAVRYDFLSSDEFRGMGGSLFPAATPPAVNNGLVLNGATQYATIANMQGRGIWLSGQAGELSVYFDFTPTFAYNDGLGHYWASCGANLFEIAKETDNLIYIVLFTSLWAVAPASYGPFWNAGAKNRIAFACKALPAASAFFINGNEINMGGAALVKSNAITTVTLGRSSAAARYFGGTITDFRIYNRKLVSAEAIEMTTLT